MALGHVIQVFLVITNIKGFFDSIPEYCQNNNLLNISRETSHTDDEKIQYV